MLRRTSLSLMAPLPLYKVGIVLVRQFAKPVAEQGVHLANQYPFLRRQFIYIGWCHFRATVHLERMIWGAEQKQQEQAQEIKIKESVKDQVEKDIKKNENIATTPDTASSTDEPLITHKVVLKEEDRKNTTINQSKQDAGDQQQQQQSATTVQIGGTNNTNNKSSTQPTSTTTPRSVKITPTVAFHTRTAQNIMNFQNPLKKVRKIFIAPPRPSDDDLLQKGMKLSVEFGMFCMFLGLVLWEMYHAAIDKAHKRQLTEERFQRLERHVIHFKDCGCPKDAQDGQLLEDVKDLEKRLDDFVPDRRKKKNVVEKGLNSDEEALAASSEDNNNNKTHHHVETDEKKSDGKPQQEMGVGKKKIDRGGKVLRIPTSVSDLFETWLALPLEVQCTVFSMFAVPYCLMAAMIIRLFSLV